MQKGIQPSQKNHDKIEQKFEDTQKLCRKNILNKYKLMV